MEQFFGNAVMQNHPLRSLKEFLEREQRLADAGEYNKLRLIGYVLEIGYDTVTVITSDPFKINVGGIPRNSLLIMVPENWEELPPHFTLLRVLESAPTPLTKEMQQTYFELQKRSMPELDVFTQSELQWGALNTGILGMFYPHPDNDNRIEFSGDLNNFVSAHKYRVYSPEAELLHLIVNALVPVDGEFPIGHLRLTENRLGTSAEEQRLVPVFVTTLDFMGTRTAMFGKTRLGKSNVVKLITQSLLETTANVGQLIFDINGEYANDNPQDGNRSIASAYPERCTVYALTPKEATPSSPLKLNFYEQPDSSKRILSSLVTQNTTGLSNYVSAFLSVELPSLETIRGMAAGSERNRAVRKIMIYWAVLNRAGFQANEVRLRTLITGRPPSELNPGFSQVVRDTIYDNRPPALPSTLTDLAREFGTAIRYQRDNNIILLSGTGNNLFDSDDLALLEFLEPQPGRSGTTIIQPYRMYHAPNAGDFVTNILGHLDNSDTVILDLGNAHPTLLEYFSDLLSGEVFQHQVSKFSNNKLSNHYIQLYFEEAHNLFPKTEDPRTIYARFAKEGAKYHIGMVYSTQSPTTVSRDLLAQTENFFIAHLSSQDDVNTLAKTEIAYESMKGDILRAKTPGYIRMLTRSHRFVVSVQARKFEVSSAKE